MMLRGTMGIMVRSLLILLIFCAYPTTATRASRMVMMAFLFIFSFFICFFYYNAQWCGFISLELTIYEELTGKGALRFAPPTCHRRAEHIKKIYLKSIQRLLEDVWS